jgi:transcriptional regulator with XRE-family HTH domain
MTAQERWTRWLIAQRGHRVRHQAADAAGVNRGSLLRAERGDNFLKPLNLWRLCAYYGSDFYEGLSLMLEAKGEREKARWKGKEK